MPNSSASAARTDSNRRNASAGRPVRYRVRISRTQAASRSGDREVRTSATTVSSSLPCWNKIVACSSSAARRVSSSRVISRAAKAWWTASASAPPRHMLSALPISRCACSRRPRDSSSRAFRVAVSNRAVSRAPRGALSAYPVLPLTSTMACPRPRRCGSRTARNRLTCACRDDTAPEGSGMPFIARAGSTPYQGKGPEAVICAWPRRSVPRPSGPYTLVTPTARTVVRVSRLPFIGSVPGD